MAGRVGGYRTPLDRTRQVQAPASGKQQRRYIYIAAGRLPRYAYAGQANCLLDEPPDPGEQQRRSRRGGYHQCQMNQVQWHLPPGGNRTPLESVTVRPLPANTLGLQTMEQISPRPSRLANLLVYILRDPLS